MERTPAACAMDWSIHLDKALRSNNPGKRMEAIQEVGARLERWSMEPELSMAEFDMFGLVHGEDKLFTNAILLRLADSFMSGDKQTKLSIVKIFLSEQKHRKTKGLNRKGKGILLKHKVENHLELLRRVKVCFNSGDEDVRALALVLFGCWSDFAKDNADICYLILSSVVSSHVLEVKASLFAAGCFCEFSNDFACVLLEMLVNMVSSSDMPISSRLAGVRAFSKLGTSSTVSIKAYQEGLKLILCSMEDDIVTTMLISLTIIASRSAILISRQVDLLISYLSQDKAKPLQATSLRCLHILLSRTRFRFSPPTDLITTMFTMLNGQGQLSPAMQCDALHILYEILLSKILTFNHSEMKECFTKLLTVVESLMQSTFISIRLFAMRVLADISGKFTKRDMSYDGDGSKALASQAISFLITKLTNMETEQEISGLLKTIVFLVNECPNLDEFVLNKVHVFIKNKNGGVLTSHVFLKLSKVVNLCLTNLMKSGPLSSQVQNLVRLLIEEVCGYRLLDCYVLIVYHLLLHPNTSYNFDESYLIKNEILALEKAKELISIKDNWSAYKVGKYAACQGAWFLSGYIFGELVTMVSSDPFSQWLTSLTLYSYSQMKTKYCNSPKDRSLLLNWLDSNRSNSQIGDLSETSIENLEEISKLLRSATEILSTNGVAPSGHYYFQIQFLSLRLNVMETVALIKKDNISQFERLSNRLLKLARAYDLLAMSFIDIDDKSRMLISSHALSCSSLAFITGFSQSNFRAMLIHDLMARIWNIDIETCKELILLLEASFGQPKTYFVPQTLENTYEVTSIIEICVNATKRMCDKNYGLEVVLEVVKKLLKLKNSLRTPRFFFNVRPHVSCELFAMNRDSGNGGRMDVLAGYHLHLDLCLQLCDISPEFRLKLTKLYCILQCKSETDKEFKDWADDNVVELNEKLANYVNDGDKIRRGYDKDCSFDGQIAETIVCFRVNGEGQGFSTCMLDVSRFGLGCYEIKWCAGCVDVDGSYWSLNSLNSGPVFTVQKSC